MVTNYIPNVEEGFYPTDGGWLHENGDIPTLLLSIPEFKHFIHLPIPKFDYAWLYSQALNAYIFCFRIQGIQHIEKAVIFQEEHAGILLKEENADHEFQIFITSEKLEDVDEDTEYLHFPKITIARQSGAKW